MRPGRIRPGLVSNLHSLPISRLFAVACPSARADGVMRTMNTEKLIKTLPTIQNQLDALLDFQVKEQEKSSHGSDLDLLHLTLFPSSAQLQ